MAKMVNLILELTCFSSHVKHWSPLFRRTKGVRPGTHALFKAHSYSTPTGHPIKTSRLTSRTPAPFVLLTSCPYVSYAKLMVVEYFQTSNN